MAFGKDDGNPVAVVGANPPVLTVLVEGWKILVVGSQEVPVMTPIDGMLV